MAVKSLRTSAVAIGAAGLLVFAAGCGENSDTSVDEVTDSVQTAIDDAGEAAQDAVGDSGDGDSGDGSNGAAGGETKTIEAGGQRYVLPAAIGTKVEEGQELLPHLGRPISGTQVIGEGYRVGFEGGDLFQTPGGEVYLVQGGILQKYDESGGPEGELGWPTSDEMAEVGGFSNTFDNGTITFAGDVATVEMNG